MQYFHQQNSLYPVLEFIEQHCHEMIEPAVLEELSFYSYRNLQRIFKSLFGETIGTYQKRIRLEKAAKLLHYSDKSITDIAFDVGYSDLQAFRKAFKKHFGNAPSQARPQLLAILQQLKQVIDIPHEAIEKLDAQEVILPDFEVVYYHHVGPYLNPELNKAWETIFEACQPAVLKKNHPIQRYGLVYDDPDITDANCCRYDICLANVPNLINTQSKVPTGTKTIAAQRYMRFSHQGNYENIEATYTAIFGAWLLANPCNFADGAILEHYYKNEDHSNSPDDFLTYIFVPF